MRAYPTPGPRSAFDEDKHLLERLQAQTTEDPRGVGYPEINLRADGAGIRVRRVLKKKLEAERTRRDS